MKDTNILLENGININSSLEIFGDIETYNETLETFLEEVKEKLQKIKDFKEVGDMANYAILVHSLKSDAKYFGFEKLAELAYKHELESKANNIYFVYENYDELIKESERIVSIVRQYLGKEVINSNITEKLANFTGKTILVVDDSNVIINLIKKIFDNKFEVLIANDGSEAINIISQNKNISGVLLDLNMPNVNGFYVLEYIKQNNLFERLPVAIITGEDSPEVISKASSYPIADILRKPFNERDVKDIVDKISNN